MVLYEKFDSFDEGIFAGSLNGHVEFIQGESTFRKLLEEATQSQEQAGGQQ